MNTQTQAVEAASTLPAWQPPPVHHVMIEQVTSKPIWSLLDLSIILDVPTSTLNEVVKDNPAPFFLLGRRKVIFREDALAWLREVADRNPWTPRKNNQTEAQKN